MKITVEISFEELKTLNKKCTQLESELDRIIDYTDDEEAVERAKCAKLDLNQIKRIISNDKSGGFNE